MSRRSSRIVLGTLTAVVWCLCGYVVVSAEDAAKPATAAEKAGPAEDPAAVNAGARHLLRYKFKPSQVVRFEVAHQMEITTQYGELTETARNKSESRKNYRIASVSADGTAELELMIDWVHMTASFGEKDPGVEFKSDDPKLQPDKFKPIMKTIGKPQATIRFDDLGRVIEVVNNTAAPITANTPATVAGPSPSTDSSHENYLVPLPENAVAIGDTWKDQFEMNARTTDALTVKVKMLRTYRLTGVKAGRAMIAFKTSILTPIHDASIEAQLIQRETAGTIVFDIEQGAVAARDVSVDRTVINPFGGKSSMRAVSIYHERMLGGPMTAQKGRSELTAPAPVKQ